MAQDIILRELRYAQERYACPLPHLGAPLPDGRKRAADLAAEVPSTYVGHTRSLGR